MRSHQEDPERGDASLFIMVSAVAVILAVGFIVDGGGKLAATDQAQFAAEQAARAASQSVSGASLRAGTNPTVDASGALAAAQDSLAANGVTGSVRVSAGTVSVDTATTYKTKFIRAIGFPSLPAEGHASAELVRGITQGGQ
ncbi:pilus assembly protein TadG-related protein [Promicromonospora sp. NFX87]|uniref:pilus assembly protein TadG-related protein n=1 Tax=Promicromonospora sp. NFX87 TaxID=3402691 RepID=UPI003AFAFE08